MRLGHGLEIVGLVGMGAHGVGERRIDRRAAEIRPDDGALRFAAESRDIAHGHLARRHARARNHRAEGVENAVLAGQHDRVGQRRVARRRHVASQAPGQIAFGRSNRR
jgi:hypothetical protein